jgi:hypothetical protein
MRVLKRLERDCRDSGKATHYAPSRRYVAGSVLDGSYPPDPRDLATAHGLTAKDAANCVLTVQRSYLRPSASTCSQKFLSAHAECRSDPISNSVDNENNERGSTT